MTTIRERHEADVGYLAAGDTGYGHEIFLTTHNDRGSLLDTLAAIAAYTTHDFTCRSTYVSVGGKPGDCTCGLEALIKELK